MSMIQTVLGPVAPEKLGLTTMHEHVLCDVSDALAPMVKAYRAKIPTQSLALVPENLASLRSGMSVFSQECCPAGDVAYTVREFRAFQAMGGGCVVDASPASMRKDLPAEMEDLREASRQSGVHVVTCTGLYVADAQPEAYKAMDEDALAAAFEADMVKGIDDQSKAGFLKCAINTLTPDGQIQPCEIKAVRACARVAAKLGASIHIHSAAPLTAEQILPVAEMVLALGVKPEKLLMLHMDSFVRRPVSDRDYIRDFAQAKTVSIDLPLRLLELGVNIGFDSWGSLIATLLEDSDRLKALVELLRRGYGGQITLGHDITDKSRGVTCGYTGFTGFIRAAFPTLKELGFEQDIRKMAVENPARILAY